MTSSQEFATAPDAKPARRPWRRKATAVLGSAALVALGLSASTQSTASAAGTADLSVTQAVSDGSASGHTTLKAFVHNAGPADASIVNLNTLITTSSGGFGVLLTNSPSGTHCELTTAPPSYKGLYSCQIPTVASGKTATLTFDYSGTQGTAFTNDIYLGARTPSDPKQSNNTSHLNSYYGPASNLVVTQKATSGAHGKATIVTTTKNFGPSTAHAIQVIMEIKSPGFSSVGYSGNISASCQFIPAATGYDRAASCTTDTLAPGKSLILTGKFQGTAGSHLSQKATASANTPADPATSNNTRTSATHYGS